MRKLAAALSRYNTQFEGYLIGRATWKIQGEGEDGTGSCQIVRQCGPVVKVEAELQRGEQVLQSIVLTMIRPSEPPVWDVNHLTCIETDHMLTKEEAEPVCVVSFSRDQILEFVRQTGDTNPIHYTACPVVPGLLILEVMQAKKPVCRQWNARFLSPVYAEEEVIIIEEKRNWLGICRGIHVFELEL